MAREKSFDKSQETTSVPGLPRSSIQRTPPSLSLTIPHGVPAVSSQPHPGTQPSRCPQHSRTTEERLRDSCREKWRKDGINHSLQRLDGKDWNSDGRRKLLTCDRSPQSTHHGRKRRRSVFGLMLDPEQRRTRQMAQLTSWSILLSRYDSIGFNGLELGSDDAYRVPATEHNINWSWKSRTWVAT